MNVNKKIVFAGVGGVLLLLFIFAAIMLAKGISQFKATERRLASTRTSLDGLYRKKPFPSPGNIKTINENVESMQDWTRGVVDFAKRKQVDPAETRSPSVFNNMLGKVKNELQVKGRSAGVEISDEFGFGFDRYMAGDQATAEHVPRLIQQLLIVNDICRILIEEKTKEIHSVQREKFDGAGVTVSTPSSRNRTGRTSRRGRNNRPPAGGSSRSANLTPASSIGAAEANDMTGKFANDDLDSKMKFVFEFSAREHGMLNILNRLAKNEMFIVVTSVDVEGAADAPDDDDVASKKPGAIKSRPIARLPFAFGGKPAVTDANSEPVASKSTYKRVPPREARVMFGGKKEQPSRVRLELEVYRFK